MAGRAGIKQAASAYSIFSRDHYETIKARGETFNDIASRSASVAAAWKALDGPSRKKYETLAANDRKRFEAEAAARDAAVEATQAARRESWGGQNAEGPRSTRTEVVARKVRKVTKEEDMSKDQLARKKEREDVRAAAKTARAETNAEVARQLKAVNEERSKKNQSRLRYLLRQSDIFKTHFGVGQDEGGSSMDTVASPTGTSKRRAAAGADDGGDDDDGEDVQPTFLLKQPPSLKGELRGYQLEGLNWMINLQSQGINGVLADEMGLGKTIQSISILAYLHDFKQIKGPHLVLLPKTVLSNWLNEFERFCPCLRPFTLSGTKEERADIVANKLRPGIPHEDRDWDVCLTTYEVANLESGPLAKIGWCYLIVDEAHRLKNEASLFSQTVRTFNSEYRLLLTGTPLQNNLHELWALLNFLLPDVFSDSEKFSEFFNLDTDDTDAKKTVIAQLHKILRPFMLRRLKSEAAKELPPKTETILFTGLTPVQRGVYKNLLMRNLDMLNSTGAGVQKTAVLNIVMQLRKCCNHPYLFQGIEDRTLPPLGQHLVDACGKLRLLDKLLARLKEQGHRVLIFSQMTKMIDILEDFMFMRGHQYCRIDGSTSYDQREDLIDAFNAPNSQKFCFLLSTRAGGLGINLQTADTVIIYDSDWNPQVDLQAQDRAHRIGQTRPVRVFRLVTENTVEEKVVERAQQKLKLDAMVVQQGRLQDKTAFDKDDLMATLRFGADAVFRSQEGAVTDEDVEVILARGEAKTAELNAKLQIAEKGDMLDFRLDAGVSAQQFEGINYGDKTTRENMRITFIDVGKRERKPVLGIPSGVTCIDLLKKKGHRLPQCLDIPNLKDWQFFDKPRILDLQTQAVEALIQLKDEGAEVPADNDDLMNMLIGSDQYEEWRHLLTQGFKNWTHSHLKSFIDASATYKRDNVEEIVKAVKRPREEVLHYMGAFWKIGEKHFTAKDWERHKTTIEKGEKRYDEIGRYERATAQVLARYENPWTQLNVPKHLYATYTPEEDRHMLCYTARYGWGAWDKVHEALLRSPRLAFDYYIRCISPEAIERRVEQLMKAMEKELQDTAKKAKIQEEKNRGSAAEAKHKAESAERAIKLKEIDEELAALGKKQHDVLKAKKAIDITLEGVETGLVDPVLLRAVFPAEMIGDPALIQQPAAPPKKPPAPKPKPQQQQQCPAPPPPPPPPTVESSGDIKPRKGKAVHYVPDSLLPELTRIIAGPIGALGINAIKDEFNRRHPEFSANVLIQKIRVVGVREARHTPTENHKIRWYVAEAFLPYLDAPLPAEESSPTANTHAPQNTYSAANQYAMHGVDTSHMAIFNEGGNSGGSSANVTPAKPVAKRKLPNIKSEGGSDVKRAKLEGGASAPSSSERSPIESQSEAPSGYVFFCKSKIAEAKSDPTQAKEDKQVLMQRLETQWVDMSDADRSVYTDLAAKADVEKKRLKAESARERRKANALAKSAQHDGSSDESGGGASSRTQSPVPSVQALNHHTQATHSHIYAPPTQPVHHQQPYATQTHPGFAYAHTHGSQQSGMSYATQMSQESGNLPPHMTQQSGAPHVAQQSGMYTAQTGQPSGYGYANGGQPQHQHIQQQQHVPQHAHAQGQTMPARALQPTYAAELQPFVQQWPMKGPDV